MKTYKQVTCVIYEHLVFHTWGQFQLCYHVTSFILGGKFHSCYHIIWYPSLSSITSSIIQCHSYPSSFFTCIFLIMFMILARLKIFISFIYYIYLEFHLSLLVPIISPIYIPFRPYHCLIRPLSYIIFLSFWSCLSFHVIFMSYHYPIQFPILTLI